MYAPAARYVRTSDGYDIAYFVHGSGQTLVRTPVMWNHVSRQWRPDYLGPAFDALSARFKLVLYDGRGQGLSTRGLPESPSIDDFALDLEAVVDRVEPGRFILSGWAGFGVVAIKYAVEHPERVSALVLWDYGDYSARPVTLLEMARKDWPMFLETTARTGYPQFEAAMVKEILVDAMWQADQIAQGEAIRRVSGEELLRQVTVPTLLLATRTGSRPMSGEEPSKRWATMLPDARLVLFDGEGGGLTAEDERVPEVIVAIEDFVKDLEDRNALTTQSRNLSSDVSPTGPASMHAAGRDAVLSGRELDVLRLLAGGKSNQQIADELIISLNTVRRHVSNIFDKTGVANRTEAAVYARDHGLA